MQLARIKQQERDNIEGQIAALSTILSKHKQVVLSEPKPKKPVRHTLILCVCVCLCNVVLDYAPTRPFPVPIQEPTQLKAKLDQVPWSKYSSTNTYLVLAAFKPPTKPPIGRVQCKAELQKALKQAEHTAMKEERRALGLKVCRRFGHVAWLQ